MGTLKENAEIRQNSKSVLYGDETSIKIIFRNLTGMNFQGKAYKDYIENIALKQGFVKGAIQLYIDGELKNNGTIK